MREEKVAYRVLPKCVLSINDTVRSVWHAEGFMFGCVCAPGNGRLAYADVKAGGRGCNRLKKIHLNL